MKTACLIVMSVIVVVGATWDFLWNNSRTERESQVAHYRSDRIQDLKLICDYIDFAATVDPSFQKWFCETKVIASKELYRRLRTNDFVGELTQQRALWRQFDDFADRNGNSIQVEKESNGETIRYCIRILDLTQSHSGPSNVSYLSVSNTIKACDTKKVP
jgi:hypothetical protein